MLLLVAIVLAGILPGCKDQKLVCGEKCSEIHAEGEKKCAKDDAACWAPIQKATDACFAECNKAK